MAADNRHLVLMIKAWSKEKLAERVAARLAPIEPEAVISVDYAIDVRFTWPFRRNGALVGIRPTVWDDWWCGIVATRASFSAI